MHSIGNIRNSSLIISRSINPLTKATDIQPIAIDPTAWVTQAEAARLRNVTRQAIARLVNNGRLRTLDIGGRAFVNRLDVLTFKPSLPGRPKRVANE